MANAGELTSAVQSRKFMRGDITRTHQCVTTDIDDYDKIRVETLLMRLNKLQDTITEVDSRIFDLLISSESTEVKMQEEYDACVGYTDKLSVCISLLQNKLASFSISQPHTSHVQLPEHTNKLKLPQIPLPTYAHKEGKTLAKFFTNLENILDKYSLTLPNHKRVL